MNWRREREKRDRKKEKEEREERIEGILEKLMEKINGCDGSSIKMCVSTLQWYMKEMALYNIRHLHFHIYFFSNN